MTKFQILTYFRIVICSKLFFNLESLFFLKRSGKFGFEFKKFNYF